MEGIGAGELVIGALEQTKVTSFNKLKIERVVCMDTCHYRNINCKESCKADERIDECLEKKCVDGILLCRESCDTVYNEGILNQGTI